MTETRLVPPPLIPQRHAPAARTVPLIPPELAISRTERQRLLTVASFTLGAIRSLLLDGAGRPVRVVGTCGYGTWRKEGRDAR